jgi:hypothetical protein
VLRVGINVIAVERRVSSPAALHEIQPCRPVNSALVIYAAGLDRRKCGSTPLALVPMRRAAALVSELAAVEAESKDAHPYYPGQRHAPRLDVSHHLNAE